jgi:aryl-alcohol dehydrogenase-like predicted oxidoreductase
MAASWSPILSQPNKNPTETVAQIALARLLPQKPWIVSIPGNAKLSRLDENIVSMTIKFTSDVLGEIDSATSEIAVQEARYPEALEKMTGR